MKPVARSELLGAAFDCECGKRHAVATREVLMAPGALAALPELAARHLPADGRALVCDENTARAAGHDAAAALGLTPLILPGDVQADVPGAAALAERLRGASAVVAVGSGTINDLGKTAAHRLGVPFLTVATAASMNGYTSSIAALLEDGLKTTVPMTPAVAVLCDLDVLAAAPPELTRAGLGDVVSKPVCNADWALSHALFDVAFCPRPAALIKELEDIYLPGADRLLSGELATLGALVEGLIYSGIAMVLAGSSAPASGAEHLLSHVQDMRSGLEGHSHDLHGAQVGVGTCFMIRLYQEALALEADQLPDPPVQELAAIEARIREDWGPAADMVLAQARPQFLNDGRGRTPIDRLRASWDAIRERCRATLAGSERIEDALRAAGAKTHYSELAMDRARYQDTIRRAPLIRNRYTLLHLLRDLGLLESMSARVLDAMDRDRR